MAQLLGHLASRLATHPENVATEALTFILQRSEPARGGLERLLGSLGCACGSPLDYTSQDGGGGSGTPDIAGRRPDGSVQVLIEAKFWAGLTQHQPISYLRRLDPNAILVFVVPTVRVDLLWTELSRRVVSANMLTEERTITDAGLTTFHAARIATPTPVEMILVSWETLLRFVADAVQQAGDASVLEDVRQLQSLCARMNDTGFLPLASEELSSGLWRRFAQLSNLVTEVADTLEHEGLATSDGRISSGPAWTGIKLNMSGVTVHLYFDADACGTLFPTPFWLKLPTAVRPLLVSFATLTPTRLFRTEDGSPYLALPVRTGVERSDVIGDIVDGCRDVADRIAPPSPAPNSPPQAAGASTVPDVFSTTHGSTQKSEPAC